MENFVHTREHQLVRVNLEAIRGNVRAFLETTKTQVLVIVKANAYGHGAVEVSRAALDAGAKYLGVTSIAEARVIRDAGIAGDILVTGPQFGEEYSGAIKYDLECTVSTIEQADTLNAIARASGKVARVQVKMDIGMGRFGVFPSEVVPFLAELKQRENLKVVGLYSHLSASDENATLTEAQQKLALDLIKQIDSAQLLPPLIHIANSGAASSYPSLWQNMVRLGIVLYGYPALPDAPVSAKLKPALEWSTRLLSIRRFPPGSTISYGAEYRTTKDELIGVIGVGYTDGFKRIPKNVNEVLVGGVKVPVRGRMCQQFCMVGLDAVPNAKIGDKVVILGNQGSQRLSALDLAKKWGTNEWDVLCGINPFVVREYFSN